MDVQFAFAPAVGTGLRLRLESVHTILKNGFSGSFFLDKLAIDQVFSYHSYALSTMLSLEIRAMTLCKAWWCMEEEPIFAETWVLPPFLLSTNKNYNKQGL